MGNANSKNRVHLFRLQTLIVDGGLLVLRHVLDFKLQHTTFGGCLAQERNTITRLKARGTITQLQYDLLYPPGGAPAPSTSDLDITLIICLLRNLKTCGLNPTFNWNVQPQAGDTSLEADVNRMRQFRNEIAHISSTTAIDTKKFNSKWIEIEQVLIRLNSTVYNPVPNLQQTINEIKTSAVEPEAEKRIEKAIKEWMEMEKRLEADVELIKADVKKVQELTSEHTKRIEGIQIKVAETEERTSEHTKLIKDTQSRVTDTEERTSEHTKLIKDTQSRVADTEERTSEHTKSIAGIQTRVTDSEELTLEHTRLIKDTQSRVTDTEQCTSEHTKLIKDTQSRVTDLETHMSKAQEDETRRKNGGTDTRTDLHSPEDAYLLRKKQLKDALATFYEDKHSEIPLSPLFEERKTPLKEFYVIPQMESIKMQTTISRGSEIKRTPIKLSELFKSDSKDAREIYLIADAGFGKTAFSKYLAVTWCQTQRAKDHLNALSQFEFVFFVSLRQSSGDCNIDDMIKEQILPFLSFSSPLSNEHLQEILHREKYLVILDGLDEWNHPSTDCTKLPKDVPHRIARKNCTILTTTRPWKLSVLETCHIKIDRKIELVKLNKHSARQLQFNAFKKIYADADGGELNCQTNDEKLKNETDGFNEISDYNLEDLKSVPLLLLYMICLWCENISLSQSKCGLYTSIIELLLSRTVKKYPYLKRPCEHSQRDYPQCFSEHEYCEKYFIFLRKLGELAFHTLFSKTKENTLVFNSAVADKFLSESEMKLSLQSGILTQSKQVTLTRQISKSSFSHKSVQEYFSALHMSCQSESDVKKIISENCKSLRNILDMSAVFVFISGMNVKLMSSISRELMSVINEDKITSTYRSKAGKCHHWHYSGLLRDIQDMYISCIKETPDNIDLKLCLGDFFIYWECGRENYKPNLERLLRQNKHNIKSLSIDHSVTDLPVCSLHEIVVPDMNNLEKLFCWSSYQEADIIRLLSETVKYADLYTTQTILSMSSALCSRFQKLSQIEGITIRWFEMSHALLEEFLNYLTNRKSMKEIRLEGLFCTDHGDSCAGCNLDLSQHSELRTLDLELIPLSQLNINVTSLEECVARELHKPSLAYLSQLSAANKLNTLACDLQFPGDIETLVQVLPSLVHLKKVELFRINLGDKLRLSPQIVNIEHVRLYGVKMSSSSFNDLVKHVEQLPHSVTIEMGSCEIIPETECEDFKQYIRTSENFVVTFDSERRIDFVKSAVATKPLIDT